MVTIEQLNATQKEWMELQNDAPEKTKARIFAALKLAPKVYMSLSKDKTQATVISGGTACHNGRISIEQARKYQGIDQSIAWHGDSGQWVQVC